jgi:prepilin-type N-terminal cleavage/methylation domain-containing protein
MKLNKLPIADCRLPIAGSGAHGIFSIGNRKSEIENGFTLVEMILAIGVTAIVLVAVNAVLFTALHLREVTTSMVDAATPVDLSAARFAMRRHADERHEQGFVRQLPPRQRHQQRRRE